MQGFQSFVSPLAYASGSGKASRRPEAYPLACVRVSTVIFVGCALVFCLSRTVVSRGAPTSAAEAWLEDGEPRWNISPPPPSQQEKPLQFFLDLGPSAKALSSSVSSKRTRRLEDLGWSGVCAVPLPGDLSSRACKKLVLPIAGQDAQPVTVPDCSQKLWGPSRFWQKIMGEGKVCPEVTLPAVGINTLLEQLDTPKIIDLASLRTGASDLSILNNFPFGQYCVRAWAVQHANSPTLKAAARSILEVSHGCTITDGADEFWARCSCNGGQQAQPDLDSSAALEGTVEEDDEDVSTPGSNKFLQGAL